MFVNLNFEEMTLDELKEIAKQNNVKVGNIGKDKLIEKINEALSENGDIGNKYDNVAVETETNEIKPETSSQLNSIMSVIDDLDDSDNDFSGEVIEKLPTNASIPVRSLTFGTLIYKSPLNNASFVWNKIGATIHMTVEETTQMNNQNENFLKKPLVVLLDERAVKQFGLISTYENVAKINDLNKVFKSDMKTISKTIDDALRVNMRDILISKVRDMYKKGTLADVNVIRLLQTKLQLDLVEDM